MTDGSGNSKLSWSSFLSPLKLALLAVNLVCFGACIVLLAMGRGSILLLIGTGLYSSGGLAGAIIAAKKRNGRGESTKNQTVEP